MAKFGTFSNLLKCLENDPNCMSDVMYESVDGKSRKLVKSVLRTLSIYF